jgi:DNA-binding LytR/AlgR family response regulator
MTRTWTALVAEDEAPQRRELCTMLTGLWPELRIAAECEDGVQALEAWLADPPDIAFLDIRMPGLNGLEVARRVGGAAHIVFVTAYDEFAVEAFEAGAVDYLLKPVRADRLGETLARLRKRALPPELDLNALLDAFADRLDRPRLIRWITASVGDNVRMISIDDVLLFQAEDKYVRVATAAQSAHIRTPLKDLQLRLDPEIFWRVHRNAIVRVSAIRNVKPDEDGRLQLRLDGLAEPINVSDSFRHRFRAM